MRPTVPEWYNAAYAVERCGWRWMAFDGMPMSSHPRYRDPDVRQNGMRVRQLLSPEQLASESWQEHLKRNNGGPADMTEPLAYTYGSSGCSALPTPDVLDDRLATELLLCVSSECENVPYDMGTKLREIVRKHLNEAKPD